MRDERTRWVELLEVLTVGLPFCAFKLLTGGLMVSITGPAPAIGVPLLGLGIADLGINAVNAGGLALSGRRPLPPCTLAAITRALRGSRPVWVWQEVGASMDVLLSMSIVAGIIGAGWIPLFSPRSLDLWNLAVITNVLGAGVARLGASLAQARHAEHMQDPT